MSGGNPTRVGGSALPWRRDLSWTEISGGRAVAKSDLMEIHESVGRSEATTCSARCMRAQTGKVGNEGRNYFADIKCLLWQWLLETFCEKCLQCSVTLMACGSSQKKLHRANERQLTTLYG